MNLRFRGSTTGGGVSRDLLLIAQRFFLVVGLLGVGYYAYTWAEAYVYQAYESWHLDQMRRRPASIGDENRERPKPGSLLGKISIPRLGLSSIVLEGDDDGVLRLGAGHISGTALPGQAGNVAVAGHRDTFFRELRNVRVNDEITLTTVDAAYHYRVESTEVVDPDDTAVLWRTSEPSVTLVTCYPFNYVGSAPKRFVVRAVEIARGPGAPPEKVLSLTSSVARPHRARAGPREIAPEDAPPAPPMPPDPSSDVREDVLQTPRPEQKTSGVRSRVRKGFARLFSHLKRYDKRDPSDAPDNEQ